MKNIYLVLLAMLFSYGWQADAQILNQSASWPNAAWTVTGTYNTAATAFEANPTTTPNFAFDDDDAGSGSDDSIAAESPIIDLTAAHAGGETTLEVTVQYGYRYLADDVLRFEYWDADAAAWVAWGANIPGNSATATNDFCAIPKTTFATPALDISAFTATQLSGFRYRISYNDSITGADYNYGFCFDSPVIKSSSCPAPSGLVVNPVASSTATITWAVIPGSSDFEYVVNTTAADPASGTVITANSYDASGLSPLTTYYFHIRTSCASSTSAWRTISFTTLATPPANDDCPAAVGLVVNPNYSCGTITAGTLSGATASAVPDNGGGTPDDDVWYSFVATATTHRISLLSVAGTPTDMVHETLSGTCDALTSVLVSDANISNPTGLVIGNTYYIRVFSYATGGTPNTTFSICVGTAPAAPANDDAAGAIGLTVNADLTCTATTNGTTISATESTDAAPSCNATGVNDDVWFTFTATSTVHRIVYSNNATGTMATALYTGTPGALTPVAGACQTGATQNFGGLTVGTLYYARVYTTVATATTQTDFTMCISTPPPPPANDECDGAVALTVNTDLNCGTVTASSTQFATQSMANTPCNGTPDDDVWFSFVATGASHQISLTNIVAVEGTGGDMYFQVLSGTCGAVTSILCSDPQTAVVSGLTAGTTYLIRVYSYGAVLRATFDICIGSFPPPPANDEASAAVALTVNPDLNCTAVTSGSTASATASADSAPSCNATGINDDVWYTFTATAAGHRFVYSNVTAGTIATALYTGAPGSLVAVPNACMTGLVQDFVGLTAGTEYYARVYTTASAVGTMASFTVCVGTLPDAPANDLCANATPLIPGGIFATNAQVGTSIAATTTDTGLTFSCQVNRILDVWYSVVVPASGSITIETDAVADSIITDTVLSVFSGTCGSLTQVGCSDDEGNGNFSKVILTGQTPGETLLVGVWKYATAPGAGGEFQVSAYDSSLASPTFDRANFSYYPNPVKDMLKVSYSETITNAVVYNLLGQQLISKAIGSSEGEIDMTSLAAGTYVVKVMTVDGSTSMKVVKE